MKVVRKAPAFDMEDEFPERDFDIYAEFEDEDAFDRGMKDFEIAFLRGFNRHN